VLLRLTHALQQRFQPIFIEYLPNFKSIGEIITRKALNLYTQGYIHKIDIYYENLPKITYVPNNGGQCENLKNLI